MNTQIKSNNVTIVQLLRALAILLAAGLLTPLVCRAQGRQLNEIMQTGIYGMQVQDDSNGQSWETLKSVSNPSISQDGVAMVFNGVLNLDAATGITKTNNTGVFYMSPHGGSCISIVMVGDDTGLGDGSTFKKFSAPLVNYYAIVAFVGTLAGGEVTKSNDTGIFAFVYPSIQLVAREGDPVADLSGFTFKSFAGLALADIGTPIFLANITDGVKTHTALFSGVPAHLIADIGDTGGDKTIKSFTVLKAQSGLFSTQPFFNNGMPNVILQVTYTDKTQAIVSAEYN